MSGPPEPFALRKYQVIVVGSTTPIVVVPSPFQSPVTGIHPGAPNVNGATSGPPEPFALRKYQVIMAGSTTPIVVVPSPFQSPVTGARAPAPLARATVGRTPASTTSA